MNLGFKQILVAIDFSEPSALALEYAQTLARRFGATLVVVHVVEEPFPVASGFSPHDIAAYRMRLVEQAKRKLVRAVATIAGVGIVAEVLVGTTARGIVEAAAAHDIDLIVMGTRGHGAAAATLMGSVAECVVRSADCPVMTVHDPRGAAEEARLAS
jgi:nucleotide-binding universal stress UspA family protein